MSGSKVFISYARSDQDVADRIRKALQSVDAAVADVSPSIAAGAQWDDAVIDQIRGSDAVVFVVPEREGAGKFALAEVGAARALGKPILALVPDPRRFANLEVGSILSQHRLIDASRMSDDMLASSITSVFKNNAA